jgi:hypothetical protein
LYSQFLSIHHIGSSLFISSLFISSHILSHLISIPKLPPQKCPFRHNYNTQSSFLSLHDPNPPNFPCQKALRTCCYPISWFKWCSWLRFTCCIRCCSTKTWKGIS